MERGEALKYFEHLNYAARVAGVTTALWDPGTVAYLNRETLKWTDPALYAWIKSSWTTRSGTASFDKVFVPKSSPITAKTLTLNPNGTKFRGLWQGSTPLAPGLDYTVTDNQLTLTARTDPADRRSPVRGQHDAPGPVLPRAALDDRRDHIRHSGAVERHGYDRLVHHSHPVPG